MSLYQKMSGMNDLVITKAGWVKFREVLSPKGKVSKGQIKYKAWKDVWMMLRKCGNYSELKAYPDSVKASSFTVEGYPLCYEDFCGFDIGEYDGLPHVLAIITGNVTYLLSPDKRDKDEWTENISKLFVEQGLFYVSVKKNCPIREGPAELRLLSTSVVLTGDTLPVCLGKWLISDIRRYGAGKDFVFELSQRFEVDKKSIVKLSTTDADAIKKLFDEMARSSSVVGHKTHQTVSKPTKSLPSYQKQVVTQTLTIPKQPKDSQQTQPAPIRFSQSTLPNRGLAYTEVEFVDTPIKPIHHSEPISNYIQVDIAATEALSKAVKQSELDNQKHAMELAKKLGPHYENNIMWTTQLYKLPVETENICEDSKLRRGSDVSFTFPEQLTNGARRSSETPFRPIEDFQQNHQRKSSDEIQSNVDYENVTINVSRNYENILLNPFEQDKGTD